MSKKTNQPKQISTMLDQNAINTAGMAPALKRDNRPFKPGTLGYWVKVAKKEIALISASNVKARQSATLG